MPNSSEPLTIKHKKKQNIGLIYELLFTYLGDAIVESDKNRFAKVSKIIETFFVSPKSPLVQENKCYDTIISTRCGNIVGARRIIETVIKHRAKYVQPEKLEQARQKLLRSIKESLGTDFWSYPISPKMYKAYASIYKVMNAYGKDDLMLESAIDVGRSKDYIVEYLTTEPSADEKIKKVLGEATPDHDVNSKLLVAKYYEHYNKEYAHLNEHQKRILTVYYAHSNNPESKVPLKKLDEHRSDLKIRLMKARSNELLNENADVGKKYYDALSKFNKGVMVVELNGSTVNSTCLDLLMYEELLEELNKKKDRK